MAMGEMACGESKPSILPVWHRDLLCTRNPPRVTRIHREFDHLPLNEKSIFENHHRSFFFGPKEIDAIRGLLPYHLAQSSSSSEVLTSFLWRCRTKALYWQDQDQEVRLLGIVSARYGRCKFNPPLPEGYYGNAFVFPAAITTVRKLCSQPLGYALELVKKAKNEATEEYVHSVVDLMAIKGRPCFTKLGSFMVSDVSKTSSRKVDFGWGKPIFYGLAKGGLGEIPGVSFYFPFTNSKGEQGRVVLICLPLDAMERFEKELNYTLKIENNNAMLMSNL